MTSEPVLSICISTYNRGEKVEALVRNILNISSQEMTVVAVDDHSSDDTAERLSDIQDTRFHFYRNATNQGARGNWFETINHGCGQYILHVLDRDWIYGEYILALLEVLNKGKISFGYIGRMFNLVNSKKGVIEEYRAGQEALEKFAFTLIHPSGFLVKKDIWDKLEDKKKFFCGESYGIYPHSYVFACLAKEYNGVLINYPMIEVINRATYARYKSKFYEKDKSSLPYWWTPEAHKWELENLTLYAYHHMDLRASLLRKILQYRFHENLHIATIQYRQHAKDPTHVRHYGLKVRYIQETELLKINVEFLWKYIVFLKKNCREILCWDFIRNLIRIGRENGREILCYR